MPFENPKVENLKKKNEKEIQWKAKEKEIEKMRDACGEKIDEGIKETVIALNLLELPTVASCEGHLDYGISAPWVEIAAPNEPEERFVDQNKAFERAAKKYGITLEEAKRAKIKEAYWEAMKECSQNGETEEYKKWKKENEKLLVKARNLLEEFYKERKVDPSIKLQITEGIDNFRIHNGGKDYKPIFEKGLKKLSDREKKNCLKDYSNIKEK